MAIYDFKRIPVDTIARLDNYTQHGSPPNAFLRCVLANDLVAAARHARPQDFFALADIAIYVYGTVPREAWGSDARVKAWVQRHADWRRGEKFAPGCVVQAIETNWVGVVQAVDNDSRDFSGKPMVVAFGVDSLAMVVGSRANDYWACADAGDARYFSTADLRLCYTADRKKVREPR